MLSFHLMKNKKALTQQSFSHQLCSLILTCNKSQTHIDMLLHSPHLTTKNLPETQRILRKYAPSVLCTTCHNDNNFPFRKEVCDTEVGHLFEHLIIDYLSQNDNAKRRFDRTYYGVTEWNWKTEPRGTFHITLSAGKRDQTLLYKAISESYQILEKILSSTSTFSETIMPFTDPSYTETVVTASV